MEMVGASFGDSLRGDVMLLNALEKWENVKKVATCVKFVAQMSMEWALGG